MRREAASRGAAVPDQTTSAVQAEEAIRVRERVMAEAIVTRLRPGAVAGALISPEAAAYMRTQVATAFASPRADLIRDELREQSEGQPDAAVEPIIHQHVTAPRVPPLLLRELPELPPQVAFDFSGRTLILRDVDANIVIDIAPNVLPETIVAPDDGAQAAPPRTDAATALLPLPDIAGATIFAAIGDMGTGGRPQQQVADAMVRYFSNARRFPFVLMLGDNLYGDDYVNEFSIPYKALLDRGVTFYAALGNHDRENEIHFKPFNMQDRSYYAFTRGNGRFVALDSNRPGDRAQHEWLDGAFGDTGTRWRIAFFHHPLYSSGEHAGQSRTAIRPALEDALVRNKVDVVFGGHEHLYERIRPQRGVRYFVSGGGGRTLYRVTASDFDEVAVSAYHFMVVSLAGDRMFFSAVTPDDRLLDCGVLWRTAEAEARDDDAVTTTWSQACEAARPATRNPGRSSAPL